MKRGCVTKSEDGDGNRLVHRNGQSQISVPRESQGTCAYTSQVCAASQVLDETPGGL